MSATHIESLHCRRRCSNSRSVSQLDRITHVVYNDYERIPPSSYLQAKLLSQHPYKSYKTQSLRQSKRKAYSPASKFPSPTPSNPPHPHPNAHAGSHPVPRCPCMLVMQTRENDRRQNSPTQSNQHGRTHTLPPVARFQWFSTCTRSECGL